jgi:hypothetical protein
MEKTAKITETKKRLPFNPPSGGTLYPYDVKLDNGDFGCSYSKTENPTELAIGNTITYTINEKNKITIVKKAEMTNTTNFNKYNKFEPVGFAFSYAKDIIVARINSKEKITDIVDEIINIAEPLAYKMYELEKRFKEE